MFLVFQGCFRSIAGVFQKAFKGVFSFIFSKNVINKLTTMSKNPAFSQKILEDWLTLPERQELFAGLPPSPPPFPPGKGPGSHYFVGTVR